MPDPSNDVPESRAVPKKQTRLSAVWIVPIVAALAGGWVAVTRILERGPTITIEFRTGEGLEAGKTKIKYKGVEIGTLHEVHLKGDGATVEGVAEMEPGTEHFLLDDTRFWIVRPRVNGANISGLGTLISGSYIALDLSTEETRGKSARHFVALNTPPVVYADVSGTFYTLKTPDLGSLDTGTPIFFRRLQVGEVSSYELDKDGQALDVKIFVDAPYDQYVTDNTRFWNASGVDVSLSATGLSVQTQSFLSVLIGGIAFETPPDGKDKVAKENTEFPLYKDKTSAFRPPAHDPQTYQLVFKDSVRGLSPGAPVEFRGIPIGEVVSVDSAMDAETLEFSAPVTVSIDAQRLGVKITDLPPGADEHAMRREIIDKLVAHGVRARLESGSLLTGALYVSFDTFPDAEAATVDWAHQPPRLPTVPGQLEALEASLNHVVQKIDQIPIGDIATKLQKTIDQMNETLATARGALTSAQGALDNTGKLVDPNSPLMAEMTSTLQSVNDAARSLRVLTDYLEQHPESLLRGKPGDKK